MFSQLSPEIALPLALEEITLHPTLDDSGVYRSVGELVEVSRLEISCLEVSWLFPFPCSNSMYDRWLCVLWSLSASPLQLRLRFPKGHDLSVTLFGTICLKNGFRTGTQAQMRPVLTSMMLQRKVSAAIHGRSAAVRSRTA